MLVYFTVVKFEYRESEAWDLGMFMASPPGLAFKILRVWMRLCVRMTNFVQTRKEGSEFREVRENRVSFEQSERRQ